MVNVLESALRSRLICSRGEGCAYTLARSAATAAAEPPELPPATLSSCVDPFGPEGLRLGPKIVFVFADLLS